MLVSTKGRHNGESDRFARTNPNEDTETREYRLKLQKQKELREQILAKKEARRKAAAEKKATELASKKVKEEKD